jgi:nicotinic acid mononucleotide adenylyltransferase
MLGPAGVEISRIEEALQTPSYTLNTLQTLQAANPGVDLRLVVGADVLRDTAKWHAFDEVCKIAPLHALGRRGVQYPGAPAPVLPGVSSTRVREALRGRPRASLSTTLRKELEEVLSGPVLDYIEEYDLYR